MRRVSSWLIAIVLFLMLFGIVMLFSTSTVRGLDVFDDPYYFLKRQALWLIISAVAATVLIKFDYHWLQKLAIPLSLASVLLLGLVFVPHIGLKVGGSCRWLRVGPFSVQPSEFAKIATIVALASWMSFIGRRAVNFKEGLLFPIMGLGVMLACIIAEPDFGTTLLLGAVGMLVLFAGGTRVSYLLVTAVLGCSAFIAAVMQNAVRMARILAFLYPEKYPATAYHLAQSKEAFIRGGLTGVGLGNSIQKQFYLPEAHTDFILAIIGEELGLLATGLIVVLFLGIMVCGIIISFRAPDTFGKLLAFGITVMICLQAMINMGVVTGCLPTKGLALPFISYGGSSMLASVCGVSILLNIAKHCADEKKDVHTRSIKDRLHRI